MLRGGGLCLAGPGDPTLNKVSPRIRALQDRLMDSLPCEGAWECLSPAQRDALISIHRARNASTDDSSEHGEGGKAGVFRKHARHQGFSRFGRSRSYDDRLESETDDSGVRGVNGTSSGATSHNSHEDDSSDPGVKRGGRFTKASSADRAGRREAKNDFHEINNAKNVRKSEVTNGFGNVNKIISKQMNKNCSMPTGPSNITLDCRNVPGKKRRNRIDVEGVFRDCSLERNLESIREVEVAKRSPGVDSQHTRLGLSRGNLLTDTYESETKLHSLKEVKESGGSSEEYDSGVNFKNDDSMDEYVRNRQSNGCDFNNDFESDRTPRSGNTSPSLPHKHDRSAERLRCKGDELTPRKPSAERDPFGGWDRPIDKSDKIRPREREIRPIISHSLENPKYPERSGKSMKPNGEPLKSNLKVGYGAKLNSSFDYRTNLNQDQMNKYSSNWNNIILNKEVPIKPSNGATSQAQAAGRETRFAKNTSSGVLTRSTGNLASKSAVAAYNKKAETTVNWMVNDPKRTPNPSQDRAGGKKYVRSKSLDRKYLDDDSSDEDSDFETRRRTERVRRYQQRTNQEWDIGRHRGNPDRGRQRTKEVMMDYKQARQLHHNNGQQMRPKAVSAWDLTAQCKRMGDEFDEFEDIGFRTRRDFRSKWQSEDSDVTRQRKLSEGSEFTRMQWNRRSCDFDLDLPSDDMGKKYDKSDLDRKRWYRRSCDLDLDFDLHHSRDQHEVEFDSEWGRHPLEDCDEFDTEFAGKGKRSRARIAEQQLLQMQLQDRLNANPTNMRLDKRRIEDESGRKTRWDDMNERRLRIEENPARRTRLEEHYRSKTSMGHHEKEKRERSRTPHLLRGKLRLLKSILSF